MPNHLYRSKPVVTTYCTAIKGEHEYFVQECDHTGKTTKQVVLTVPAEKFEEQFEPVKRQTKKTHVNTNEG